jgi:hypothetical protein
MAGLSETPKLTAMVAAYTLTWVVVYFPLETFVTWSIAGPRGFMNPSYVENIVGMGLMLWGAVSAKRGRPFAPGLLTTGWSWTAATFWRATADRFWWVSLGYDLFAGRIELWLGPILTALAVIGLSGSLVLVFRSQPTQT